MKKHQVWDTTCVNCRQAITNPVCPDCMEQEVVEWAVTECRSLVSRLRGTIYKNVTEDNADTKCILCGNRMELCTYCVKKDVLDFLSTDRPELVASFKSHFGI